MIFLQEFKRALCRGDLTTRCKYLCISEKLSQKVRENSATRCRYLCMSEKIKIEDSKWRNIIINQQSPTGFEDTKTLHLLRTAFVQRLCSNQYFVDNSLKLMDFTRRIVGHQIFSRIMDMTFYGHFCVGTKLEETTNDLLRQNIRPMILITVEEEAQDENIGDKSREKWYTDNKNLILHSITQCHATQTGQQPKFVHFRLTGLMPSNVLTKISTFLNDQHQKRTKGRDPSAVEDLLNFQSLINGEEGSPNVLTGAELKQIKDGLQHFKEICEDAERRKVFILVDAEYTSFNPGIRVVTNFMKLTFNQHQPLVQHTFQAYLKKTINELKDNVEFCRHYNICFGTKIVRGAYMVSERHLANKNGREDPVCKNKGATNDSYNQCVSYVIRTLKPEKVKKGHLMVACHNEESINLAIDAMRLLQIDPQEGLVTFGQTYGLSDYITKWLGKNGYIVFKSTPIGSVYDTLPYLYRRAHENKAALDFRQDKLLVKRELRRRFQKKNFPFSSANKT